jgi:hypothetical protein
MKQMHWFIVLAVVSLAIHARLFIVPTQARNDEPGVRFEYAWMYLPDKGLPILKQAESETKIYPSTDTGSGLIKNMRKGLGGYRLQTSLVRNYAAGALDIAGQDGWEAVNIISNADGSNVLLKRPL